MAQSHSAEGRLLAFLGSVLPEGSELALILRDLLDDEPESEPGEARFVADAHSVIFALIGSGFLMLAIGAGAAIDALWGHRVANLAGAVLFAPVVFLIALAQYVQLAKFRHRFDGVQPVIGPVAWAGCGLVTISVVLWVALHK